MTVASSISINGGYQTDGFAFVRFMSLADQWPEACTGFVDSAMDWHALVKAMSGTGFTLNLNVDEHAAVFTIDTGNGPAVVKVENWGDGFGLTSAGLTHEGAHAALAACEALIPKRAYGSSTSVPVSFWSYDPMSGGIRYVRELDRQQWADVRPNYPASVREKLDKITSLTDAPSNGRMFVFHGPPGTGKSRLLQTIASEWQTWCSVEYIVDSDMFFGSAAYMTAVMLGNRNDDRWRLVVAEDSDEFIDAHSKAKTGQGSARLLNIADGLVGQGLKVMVLASTNVHSARFSKAVVRPGRCAAMVEFPPFPQDEAAEWATAAGLEHEFDGPATLADLYALKNGTL